MGVLRAYPLHNHLNKSLYDGELMYYINKNTVRIKFTAYEFEKNKLSNLQAFISAQVYIKKIVNVEGQTDHQSQRLLEK